MPTEKTAAERWYEGQRDSLKKDSIQAALNEYDESIKLLQADSIIAKAEEIALVHRIVNDFDLLTNAGLNHFKGEWLNRTGREFINLVRLFASRGKMSTYYFGVDSVESALGHFLEWCDTKIEQEKKLEDAGIVRKAENIPAFNPKAVFGR